MLASAAAATVSLQASDSSRSIMKQQRGGSFLTWFLHKKSRVSPVFALAGLLLLRL